MKVVFFSNHAWGTPNKAGFHRLANACARLGCEVTFITTGLSLFSVLRRDARLKTGRPLNRLVAEAPGVQSFLHFTLWHPHTLLVPALNRMTAPRVRRYDQFGMGEAEERIQEADVIFYESCSAVCLLESMKKKAPRAKHIYRASDFITAMHSLHPEVFRLEEQNIPRFDMISVPAESMRSHFAANPHVYVHHHGVDTEAYDRETVNPYATSEKNCVFIGNAYLDEPFLKAAAAALPQVQFHIIGPFGRTVDSANVHYYGRLQYDETLRYIKFADVGLYCLESPREEIMRSMGESLKMQQYRYCMLPVVLPRGIKVRESREFSFYDLNEPESIVQALREALSKGHAPEWREGIRPWPQVAAKIFEDLEHCSPCRAGNAH